jgi:hypothetical protein
MKPEIIDADEANTRNREEDHDDTKAYQEERETEQQEADYYPSEGYGDY